MVQSSRILILGGGFGGLYTALELEKQLGGRPDVEITLVNRDNFFLFTPMLHEVAASDLDSSNIVNPIRKMLRITQFFAGEIEAIDLERRTVSVTHGIDTRHNHELPYDHLVLALGSVTNFHGIGGLSELALPMKSLEDAVRLRDRLIEQLEEADFECSTLPPEQLLTFVVAGGGFAGVETIAAINDFLRHALKFYPNLKPEMLRLVLVDSHSTVLPELGEELGRYAQRKLEERKVEFRLGVRIAAVSADSITLSDGSALPARTLVWTAGTAPCPLLETLDCAKQRGRVVVKDDLELPGFPGVWALGDCAAVADESTGGFCPPTAQHALRQGKTLGRNIAAAILGKPTQSFRFTTIGQLAAIGRRTGVAKIFGIKFSGFVAWWLWRTIYLAKLPRFEKKLRVALDWTLDLAFSKDLTQLKQARSAMSSKRTSQTAAAKWQGESGIRGSSTSAVGENPGVLHPQWSSHSSR
jgi:NADH dehydrogenase